MTKVDYYNVLLYIKISDKTTYYQENGEIILNRAKKYKNNKERLKEWDRNKYRRLSEEEKNIKRAYGRNSYNMFEENKQRQKEYQKSYRKTKEEA